MKILYIAPVRDFSGYAVAARGYIRALHEAGADLVVRPVRYDQADMGTGYQVTDLERKLLKRDLNNVDVVIQHLTPNEMRPVEGKVNIAIVAWETTRIPQYWVDKLNQFDSVITFCQASVDAFEDCGVKVPIYKVPHTFDIPSYNLEGVEPISAPSSPDILKDRFIFYNISQFSSKKGVDVLLRSYFGAFHGRRDDVMLILKTYINMTDREKERSQLLQYIDNVRAGMRLPPGGYPQVMLITNTLTDEQMKKVHATGDAYVCSSRGEGWCSLPGAKVLTSDGYKNIEDVQYNDLVLTHKNNWKPVTNLLDRIYDGNILNITTWYDRKIQLTPNHNVYTLRGWVRADELTLQDSLAMSNHRPVLISQPTIQLSNHYAYIKSNDGLRYKNTNQTGKIFGGKQIHLDEEIVITPAFAKLLGLYIAEGSCNQKRSRQPKLSIHTKETDRVIKIITDAIGHDINLYIENKDRNRTTITINNSALGAVLSNVCGHLAVNKHLPTDYQTWPRELIISLLSGYWFGDGTHDNVRNTISYSTVSKILAYQVRDAMSMIGFMCSIYHRDKSAKANELDEYVTKLSKIQRNELARLFKISFDDQRKRISPAKFTVDDNNFYLKIKDISTTNYIGTVYNLSVLDDESYTLDQIKVHNCIPAFDALAYGNKLVTTLWGGMGEFARNIEDDIEDDEMHSQIEPHTAAFSSACCRENVYPVDYSLEPLVGQIHGDPDLYTSFDLIAEPSVSAMMREMKQAMEDRDVKDPAPDLMEFDHSIVGPKMLKVIKNIEVKNDV